MRRTSAKNHGGKYSQIIQRPTKCPGCGALCAGYLSLHDHLSDCPQYKDRIEFMSVVIPQYERPDVPT